MADAKPAANALAGETSPYLLQHAGNPVEWYPWGEAALARARDEDKPILLSVGYSACHWCHVMAHESFEDEATARLMNELFVNVKVDREERPDIDKIYQLSHQLLTRRAGGWPLTAFLSPDDRAPFFAGTYFPPEPRYGMPSFKDVLVRIAAFFREHRDDIRQQNASLVAALRSLEPEPGGDDAIDARPLADAREQLSDLYDGRFGGFGPAPKFPHPSNLERLLRDHAASAQRGSPDVRALEMASHTLRAMIHGGIYDQLGGGFCRYSVDEQWMIPHFEKMLYDNGPLLALCAQAWQITGADEFRRAALETGAWVMREMQDPDGGYYSSLDADSEGVEGKFYVWQRDEVRALLDDDAHAVAAARYGLDRGPNFEGYAWHLHVHRDTDELARELSLPREEIERRLARARTALLAARDARVRPGRDEKVLTSWNGLMIRGMALAGRILDEPDLVASAERALDHLRGVLWRDGRLLATAKDGRAHLDAYLDDHAFVIDALLALLEARWRDGDLDFATELADTMLERFADRREGGFFFTGNDHETLIHRTKSMMDDALPAGNAVAATALLRLGHLLGETRYLEAAEATLRAAWRSLARVPHAHTAMLTALEEYLHPPQTIVLRGAGDALETWRRRAGRGFAPRRLALAVPDSAQGLGGLLAERAPRGDVVAYVCEGHRCDAPITDFEAFDAALRDHEVPRPA